ncbi:TRAP transporter substrate-binding protein [Arhodomonas sp. AD133]|uniref:TRAP transporter substrate-binding protein n=1 Tax=Arhodomonas sp. AD133 TaxID=3415009 RepID=UPI003EBBAF39
MALNRLLKRLAVAGVALALSAGAEAATTVNLSYNGAPDADKNAVHLFASNFKRLVEEKTDGAIEIKLYPNSMLGEEQARMEQVMNQPMLNVASFAGVSPLFPEIFVTSIPFLFEDFSAARRFFDEGEFWRTAREEWRDRTGTRMLAVVEEGGFLAFTNNEHPIHDPSDFDGLRFRAMDKSQVALFEAFGASGTPIPWTEVYMALRTGVADGQMNPPMYIILGSLHEVQKYLTLANIQYSDQFLVANDALMQGLSEDERQAVEAAAAEANRINREAVQAKVAERVDFLAENGMEVYRPTDEELARFREVGQPAYMDWLRDQGIDERWIEMALDDAGLDAIAAE